MSASNTLKLILLILCMVLITYESEFVAPEFLSDEALISGTWEIDETSSFFEVIPNTSGEAVPLTVATGVDVLL